MPGAYWVNTVRKVHDQGRLDAYVALATPAIAAAGGRFVARGRAIAAYELGTTERTAVIAFDTVEAALAAYDSEGYQRALAALGDGADRDIRIVEAVD